jgi:hypothetical protein
LPTFPRAALEETGSYDETDSFEKGDKARAKESLSSTSSESEAPEEDLDEGVPLVPPPELFNPGITVTDVEAAKAKSTMELLVKTTPGASPYRAIFGGSEPSKPLPDPNPSAMAELGAKYGFAEMFARFQALKD